MKRVPYYKLDEPSYDLFYYYNILNEIQIDLLNKTISNKDFKTALNLGCGHGIYERLLIEKNIQTTSVDVRQTNLEFLKSKGIKSNFIRCDLDIDYPEGKYDLVIALDLFKWTTNWRFLLNNIASSTNSLALVSFHCMPDVKEYRHYIQPLDVLWGRQYTFDRSYNGLLTVFSQIFIENELKQYFHIINQLTLRCTYSIKPQHEGDKNYNPWVGDFEIIYILERISQ